MKTQMKKVQDSVNQYMISRLGKVKGEYTPYLLNPFIGLPYNPTEQYYYSGMNALLLHLTAAFRETRSASFATFKQIKSKGGSIRKGSQLYPALLIRPSYYLEKERIDSELYKQLLYSEHKSKLSERIFIKVFYVANFDDVIGLEKLDTRINQTVEHHQAKELIDEYTGKMGVNLNYREVNVAFYSPSHHSITLPKLNTFRDQQTMVSVFLHELAHWTIAENQLKLRLDGEGRIPYAYEEMVAELTACYLCMEHGFIKPMKEAALYIDHYLKAITSDPEFAWNAMSDASRCHKLIREIVPFFPLNHLEECNSVPF